MKRPGASLVRAMRDALRGVSGMHVTDRDGEDVIRELRALGVMLVYTEQVEQWGEMGNCCVYQETGQQCPFCRCEGRNMKIGKRHDTKTETK
jgi:hypothetical protein